MPEKKIKFLSCYNRKYTETNLWQYIHNNPLQMAPADLTSFEELAERHSLSPNQGGYDPHNSGVCIIHLFVIQLYYFRHSRPFTLW